MGPFWFFDRGAFSFRSGGGRWVLFGSLIEERFASGQVGAGGSSLVLWIEESLASGQVGAGGSFLVLWIEERLASGQLPVTWGQVGQAWSFG